MVAVPKRDADDPLIGKHIQGYRIDRLIGEGAAARVYHATHGYLRREVALKVLLTESINQPGMVARFRREAMLLFEMNHDNIVKVFDFGTLTNGRPFIAMEYLDGQSLRTCLEGRRLKRNHIIHIARQIAEALAVAHDAGLVHRDMKPGNIMLVGPPRREVVKLLDFGIVRSGRAETQLTGHQVLLGTPRYMSPEQVINPTCVSAASDLYSLGIILYEMLSGDAPFQGTVIELVEKQLGARPATLTTNTGLEALAEQLLAKRPEDRPKSARDVAQMLCDLAVQPEIVTRLDSYGASELRTLHELEGAPTEYDRDWDIEDTELDFAAKEPTLGARAAGDSTNLYTPDEANPRDFGPPTAPIEEVGDTVKLSAAKLRAAIEPAPQRVRPRRSRRPRASSRVSKWIAAVILVTALVALGVAAAALLLGEDQVVVVQPQPLAPLQSDPEREVPASGPVVSALHLR